MQKILRKILIILIITVTAFLNLNAQTGDIIFDSKGKDFWLAFLPNYHNFYGNGYANVLRRADSLYIFIVADKPTQGIIEYKDRDGNDYSENFNITNTNEIYTFQVSHYDFEITGYNRSGTILDNDDPINQSEKPAPNSFHITADNEITVYAHSQAVTTSDAFLVLPTDVLGEEHIILSYNSDGAINSWGIEGGGSTPSQFLIVATEDNTGIEINPSTAVHVRGDGIFNIVLNKGEVFLVQAGISPQNEQADLTGTEVISDKPVAIFSGEQRATIPVNFLTLSSRDFIAEQMLPIKTWGKNAFIIPHTHPANATLEGDDLFRILVGTDNTTVSFNGISQGVFNRGEKIQRNIKGALTIEANGPILVAEYKKTASGSDNAGMQPLSDPFMMLVPPKEQFMTDYSVINTQAYEDELDNDWNGNTYPTGKKFKVYSEHYIAIVAPQNAINNTKIDGILINRGSFNAIPPNSEYYYANIKVGEGAHRVSSSGRVGVYVYGYGYANSYGYVGGLSMMEFDFKKPDIQSVDSCYNIRGMVYEINLGDTKIQSVNSPDSVKANVNVQIEKFQPCKDSVSFSASLIDKYLDGKFSIVAKDSSGLDSIKYFDIAGFTVSVDSMGASKKVILLDKRCRTGIRICETYELKNYGKFTHDITEFYFKNGSNIEVNHPAPFTIVSKEVLPLELCFQSDRDTVITDTLIIAEECGKRQLIAVRLKFESDNTGPDISLLTDSCKKSYKITIRESSIFDWGIESVKVNKAVNCNLTEMNFTRIKAEFLLEVANPYKDAIYDISAVDSAGNAMTISDTIQGFTIDMPQFVPADDTSSVRAVIDFGKEKIGSLNTDTLVLENSGIKQFIIDNIFLKRNTIFSIPQSQFPLVIEPGEREEVYISFHPINTWNLFKDTLVISHNCLAKEIELEGEGDSLVHYGESNCKVRIKTTSTAISPEYFLDQNTPNPVLSTTNINFGLGESGSVKLKIFDLYGTERIRVLNAQLGKGTYNLSVSLENLPEGIYFYVLECNGLRITKKIIKE